MGKNEILCKIDKCENPKQLFSLRKIISNFIDQYKDQLAKEQLLTAYREKYNEID